MTTFSCRWISTIIFSLILQQQYKEKLKYNWTNKVVKEETENADNKYEGKEVCATVDQQGLLVSSVSAVL